MKIKFALVRWWANFARVFHAASGHLENRNSFSREIYFPRYMRTVSCVRNCFHSHPYCALILITAALLHDHIFRRLQEYEFVMIQIYFSIEMETDENPLVSFPRSGASTFWSPLTEAQFTLDDATTEYTYEFYDRECSGAISRETRRNLNPRRASPARRMSLRAAKTKDRSFPLSKLRALVMETVREVANYKQRSKLMRIDLCWCEESKLWGNNSATGQCSLCSFHHTRKFLGRILL